MVKTHELSEAQRLKIVELRIDKKMSFSSIAEQIGCSRSGVQGVINKIKTFGTVKNLLRSGRKRCTNVRTDRIIKQLVKKDRNMKAREVVDQLANRKQSVSVKTIRRRLKENNFFSGFATNKPLISEKNRLKRLSFAKRYLRMPLSFWNRVLWSDESKFEIISSRRIRCWKKKAKD